jgi:cytochrome c-type biogenesis protein CcmH/NrfG
VGAWIQLGQVYFETNQYKRAIAAYRKALTIEPDNANVLTDLENIKKEATWHSI